MAIRRGYRFEVPFEAAFPRGLVLVGEIAPDYEFQSGEERARGRERRQRVDVLTGKRIFKGTVTDPDEPRAKRASFDVRFTCDVQPVPSTDEVLPGMRQVELEGLQVEPKVTGQGEFKSLTYDVWATGIRDTRAGRNTGKSSSPGSQSAAA